MFATPIVSFVDAYAALVAVSGVNGDVELSDLAALLPNHGTMCLKQLVGIIKSEPTPGGVQLRGALPLSRASIYYENQLRIAASSDAR
jgi:hypothetical protein